MGSKLSDHSELSESDAWPCEHVLPGVVWQLGFFGLDAKFLSIKSYQSDQIHLSSPVIGSLAQRLLNRRLGSGHKSSEQPPRSISFSKTLLSPIDLSFLFHLGYRKVFIVDFPKLSLSISHEHKRDC